MEKLSQRVQALDSKRDAGNLFPVLSDIYNRLNSACLSSAGLTISATTTKVKTGDSATIVSAQGVIRSIAAATDMPVLVGTVANAKFNVFVFSVDSAGTTYTQMGTAAYSLAGVKWPNVPAKRCVIGFVIINPTGTGNFVGGTTPLSDATVVPNAVYVNTQGAFDPNANIN